MYIHVFDQLRNRLPLSCKCLTQNNAQLLLVAYCMHVANAVHIHTHGEIGMLVIYLSSVPLTRAKGYYFPVR